MDLGLTLEELLGLQPCQFYLMAAYARRRRREGDLMLAQIAAAVVNSGFSRPEKGVVADDFLLREIKRGPMVRLTEDRQQEIANSFRRLFADINRNRTR